MYALNIFAMSVGNDLEVTTCNQQMPAKFSAVLVLAAPCSGQRCGASVIARGKSHFNLLILRALARSTTIAALVSRLAILIKCLQENIIEIDCANKQIKITPRHRLGGASSPLLASWPHACIFVRTQSH